MTRVSQVAGVAGIKVLAGSLLACCVAATAVHSLPDPAVTPGPAIRDIDPSRLAQLKPGISKTQVRRLLGAPWRTVQYNDMDEVENEIWEYRGRDAAGTYRIHIEFDRHDVVRLVGKIPDDVSGGKGTAAQT
jgi:hypothetical protein